MFVHSHIRGEITDSDCEVTLRAAVPDSPGVQVIHQRSDVRSDRVTVPQSRHLRMIYAELQSADEPLSLQSEQAVC